MNSVDKLVAIVVVNYNCYRDTSRCLSSLLSLEYPNFKIYCVDNASQDDSLAQLKLEYPQAQIQFIASNENTGFAGGCNIGIRAGLAAGAHFVWLLNADATAKSDSLSALANVLDEFPRVAAVGSKILFPPEQDKPATIWSAGGALNFETRETSMYGTAELDRGQYDKLMVCDYLPGCSILIRREAIEQLGLLPEHYFMYFEETHWCVQALRKFGPLLYVPQSVVWHHFAKDKTETPFMVYYYNRNSLFFWFSNSTSVVAKLKVLVVALKALRRCTYAHYKAPNADLKQIFRSHMLANLHFLLRKSGRYKQL